MCNIKIYKSNPFTFIFTFKFDCQLKLSLDR